MTTFEQCLERIDEFDSLANRVKLGLENLETGIKYDFEDLTKKNSELHYELEKLVEVVEDTNHEINLLHRALVTEVTDRITSANTGEMSGIDCARNVLLDLGEWEEMVISPSQWLSNRMDKRAVAIFEEKINNNDESSEAIEIWKEIFYDPSKTWILFFSKLREFLYEEFMPACKDATEPEECIQTYNEEIDTTVEDAQAIADDCDMYYEEIEFFIIRCDDEELISQLRKAQIDLNDIGFWASRDVIVLGDNKADVEGTDPLGDVSENVDSGNQALAPGKMERMSESARRIDSLMEQLELDFNMTLSDRTRKMGERAKVTLMVLGLIGELLDKRK